MNPARAARHLGARRYRIDDRPPTAEDRAAVEALLGRPSRAGFSVVVRRDDGWPVVIRNDPLLDDGTPMPTRYWLVGDEECRLMGRLESLGGVDRAEAAVDPARLRNAHAAYERDRSAALPPDHDGPRPTGGIGGTARGVKCLHAHLAHWLAGGDDPVGDWAVAHLHEVDTEVWPPR